jgi:hypothetical protein
MSTASGSSQPDAHPSEILRLAGMLRDEARVAAIGSRLIREQIASYVARALGRGPGPVAWSQNWDDHGNVWANWADTDEWPDVKGMPGRSIDPRIAPTRQIPELVFSDEELAVLRELRIIQ